MKILNIHWTMILCLIVFYSSCNDNKKDCCVEPLPVIYKIKGNYINYVCIGLNNNKTKIFVYPGPTDNCGSPNVSPIELKNGYYFDNCCNYGINSAYLSITKREYQEKYPIPEDSMFNLILDSDPYLEYYLVDNDKWNKIEPCSDCFVIDTASLNEIISNQELEKYFTRIK